MRHAVIFDLDGTLIDSRADLATGVNLTRAEFGLAPLDPAEVAGFVGDGVRKLLQRALPECPERLEAAMEVNRRHYGAHLLDATRAYPGAAQALDDLRALGCRLAVVTNKPREFTLPILAGLGLADRFDAILAGGDGPALKPDPGPLLQALDRCGAAAEGSWIAGDHYTDLEAGRRAGMKRCWCRYGFGDPRGEPWDLAVDGLPDLAAALRNYF